MKTCALLIVFFFVSPGITFELFRKEDINTIFISSTKYLEDLLDLQMKLQSRLDEGVGQFYKPNQ